MLLLVVGEQGQLARALAESPPPSGMQVLTIGRPVLDLLHSDSIVSALDRTDPDLVVNAAAYTAVDKAESEPDSAFAINAVGVGSLATACAERSVPVIHLSTDYVYDGTKQEPYVESDPVNPINVYGRSKLAGERKLAEANPRHVILRTAWIYAPYGTNFVGTMLRLGETRAEIGVVNDQQGNPTYAPHLASAVLTIAEKLAGEERPERLWGTYHAAGTGETTWFGMAKEIFRCRRSFGRTVPVVRPIATVEYPTPAARPMNSRLDTSKLERNFGVRLPFWKRGVEDCTFRLTEGVGGGAT